MANKYWIAAVLQSLEQSLAPVPHEVNELDWKASLSDHKDRLAEHLMAFANHPNGGSFVFGVANSGQLLGIDQEAVAQIANTLSNLGRDAVEPPLALDHAVVEFKGMPILLVHVPEQAVKPVHRRGKSIEESWVRSSGTTRKASRQEVGALMLNSATPRWEELRASSLLPLEDVLRQLDVAAIAKLLERPLPDGSDELGQWLLAEGLAVADGRGFYITNFGAIAAARKLDEFGTLERKRIRVIRYRGTNKVETIDELPGNKGYAVGFEGLIGYLKRALPHSEVIQQSLRTEVSVYPEIALRELIANALIHQDFTVTGAGPMVEIYDDRIEVTNPGTLLPGKRPDRLIGTTPESRNEMLASSFRRYRICEERGTGFQKVVGAIELFGLPPLVFTLQENSFRVTLYAPRKFSEMSQTERVEACYQHAVLQYLSSSTLTNTTVRERFKLHEKHRNQITNLIGDAVALGRIKRKDAGNGKKFAEYLPYWA
ncbi:putative DNA binding domain-containing protein [Rhodoferax sp. U2-2l]|uniref:ATP-binding protein n=1 Tax=Rhodoferax sp. U2-2l TaxID=2884000 RepID=UPI001D0A7336|nr:ATP-binding protein [Rhodoferax sp. U2-2l]MCB8748451.1 putative DNA binding domain-containing protein [Rhodoferax sp. U2-2l]